MTGYPIRPSQFVLTYGVGSIIETPSGPRIIPMFENWDGLVDDIKRFSLRATTNLKAILPNSNFFKIPSNVELGEIESRAVFKTYAFPNWVLCVPHKRISKNICRECERMGTKNRSAIRFIRACPDGHMDDVDWHAAIHGENPTCKPVYYSWVEKTQSAKDVWISCPKCGKQRNLADIYNINHPCSGRIPESNKPNEKCDKLSKIVLRGSSVVRRPEMLTSVCVPPRSSNLHWIFERESIKSVLHLSSIQGEFDRKKFINDLRQISDKSPDLVNPEEVDVVERSEEEKLKDAVYDTLHDKAAPKDMEELKDEEFRKILHTARYGHPKDPTKTEGENFVVNPHAIRNDVMLDPHHKLRIVPIERLSVALVQTGYRRLGTGSKLVDTCYVSGNTKWYPGIILLGEGLFIDMPSTDPKIDENSWKKWYGLYEKTGKKEHHPVYIWWHTLSHRLLFALSMNSGYSSTSIRERIYVNIDEKTHKATGGILLYTAQTGGDGTMGGLVSLVPSFESTLDTAVRNIKICSNDPLCSENAATGGRGAACHACLLVSETSCDQHNTCLDRNVMGGLQ